VSLLHQPRDATAGHSGVYPVGTSTRGHDAASRTQHAVSVSLEDCVDHGACGIEGKLTVPARLVPDRRFSHDHIYPDAAGLGRAGSGQLGCGRVRGQLCVPRNPAGLCHPAAAVVRLVREAPARATGGCPPPARGSVRPRPRSQRTRCGHGRAQAGRAHRVYRYCVEEQLLEHSPAVHVRRPKVSQESTRLGLDRTELGAFLVQAGVSGGNDHALACLLALNALHVSEACGAELSDLALANGHRVVRVVGKGNQPALIPLAPRTSRAIDAAVGERTNGPLLARADGSRLDRHAAGRIVRRLARRAGIDKPISPTPCGTPRSPPPSTPDAACETCRTSHGMPTHVRPAATTAPAARSTATPPTSSRPTSPEPPAHGDNCPRHGCRVPTPRGSRDDVRSGRRPPAPTTAPSR
jgi:hypothetical protein